MKQLEPPSAPATVQIDFRVLGILPDLVQIYASGVSGQLGSLIQELDMQSPENTYTTTITLAAGTAFVIGLCPRTKTGGVLDDTMDGQPWETFCTFSPFTTQAPPGPPPHPKLPAPTIGAIEPHQATLTAESRIDVHWTGSSQFDLYHFMWMEQGHGWTEIEINSGGSSGVWTVSPVSPQRTYSFKVQGCVSKLIGLDDCSPFSAPVSFPMPPYTHSLREFLRLANVRLNPGIRSLGKAAYGAGIRGMMRLR